MNSNKTLLLGGIVVVALAFAAGYALKGDGTDVDSSPSPSPTASASPTPSATVRPVTHAVSITASGPLPKILTIRAGDSVTFTNENSTGYWPASDPHPTHTLCPGFDARRPLTQGDSYTLKFSERRTCGYHNHLDPFSEASQGTIIVQ